MKLYYRILCRLVIIDCSLLGWILFLDWAKSLFGPDGAP